MEKMKLQVSGSQIEVVEIPEVITAGTVGLPVEFAFDSQWDNLAKTAVFKAGDRVIAVALEKDTHTVPWEVLEKPNLWLCIGVYGANGEGTVVIPTLWAKVAVIHTGVDPEGDSALDPTLPIWQELLTRAEENSDALHDTQTAINNHIDNAGGDNPHNVTCEQIGAATKEELETSSPVFVTLVSLDEESGEYVSSKSFKEIAEAYENNKIIYALHDNLVYNFAGIVRDYAQFVSVDTTFLDQPHPVKLFDVGDFFNDLGEPYTKVDFSGIDNIALATTFYVDEKYYNHLVDAGLLEYEDGEELYHGHRMDNPHGVTAEQIGAATKADVEAIKAIVVTVSGTTPSHTNAEIHAAMAAGKVVYLKMWEGTYTICVSATPTEAKFESSYFTSVTGADGKAYSAQQFRVFIIQNDTYRMNNLTAPSQAYIDAQIAYYLGNKEA